MVLINWIHVQPHDLVFRKIRQGFADSFQKIDFVVRHRGDDAFQRRGNPGLVAFFEKRLKEKNSFVEQVKC